MTKLLSSIFEYFHYGLNYVCLFLHRFRRYGNNERSTWNIIKIVNVLIIFRLVRIIFSIKVGTNTNIDLVIYPRTN
jgi:NhaP-type Na+/H+ or K+/H+ antiporter